MKHQWNGEIPSPGGKVARRKPGRMRNGDAVGQGMHPNKTDKGFGFNHFYGVHRNILLFAVPHQSPKSVPKCRFGRQLPPGGSYGRCRASAFIYNLACKNVTGRCPGVPDDTTPGAPLSAGTARQITIYRFSLLKNMRILYMKHCASTRGRL